MIRLTVPYFEGSSTCGAYEYGLPATWDGVIAGRSRFTSNQQLNLIASPPEQTCSSGKGIGAYINSTSQSQNVVLNIHLSAYVQ